MAWKLSWSQRPDSTFRRSRSADSNRVGLRKGFSTLARLPIATVSSDRSVRGASAVFSMGGYVAGPPVLAAIFRRIPVVVMEPNAVPGFTNRSISRLVSRALVSFPETAAFFPSGRTEVTGLPVREEFFHILPKMRGPVLHLLISGGSQGSRTLNHALQQSWPLFLKAGFPVYITHQTGVRDFAEVRDAFASSGIEGEVVPFISDMPAAFAAADLVSAAPARARCPNSPLPASHRFWFRSPLPPTITRPAMPRPWSAAAHRAWCATPR